MRSRKPALTHRRRKGGQSIMENMAAMAKDNVKSLSQHPAVQKAANAALNHPAVKEGLAKADTAMQNAHQVVGQAVSKAVGAAAKAATKMAAAAPAPAAASTGGKKQKKPKMTKKRKSRRHKK
jgi:hypothetical protein